MVGSDEPLAHELGRPATPAAPLLLLLGAITTPAVALDLRDRAAALDSARS